MDARDMKCIVGRQYENSLGHKFTVMSKSGRNEAGRQLYLVRFNKTNHEALNTRQTIVRGRVKDPLAPNVMNLGFVGVGRYSSATHPKIYRVWCAMFSRCYNGERPSYSDCEVCEEWHNFQNFAVWAEARYKKGLQLDKDIKIKGNKKYSPEACSFITQQENAAYAQAKTYTFKSPRGEKTEIYNLEKFCRDNSINCSSLWNVVKGTCNQHKGWSRWDQEQKVTA